jgi:two-component system sensor histidine kinase UhpB
LLGSSLQREPFTLGRFLAVPARRGFSLRTRLCLFAVILMVAALAPATVEVLRSISAERTRIDAGLGNTLDGLSVEIEREIRGNTNVLVILATSNFLQSDDLESFHQRAEKISRQLGGTQIVVHRLRGDQRVASTGVPWNEASTVTLPPACLEAEQRAIESGKVVISDVFFSPVSERYLVAAVMPVLRNGVAEYVVSLGIPIQKFSDIIDNAPPGPDRVVAVLDRSHHFIARSARNKLPEGTTALSDFSSQLSGAEGTFDSSNRFGEAFHGRYRRLESTGWHIAVGVRTSALAASSRKTLAYEAAAGTLLFASVIGLTFIFGTRLQQRTGTLGIDRAPTRDEFALLFDFAPHGVLLVNDQGIVLLANARLEAMFGYAQAEIVGRPVEMLVPGELRSDHIQHRHAFTEHPASRPMGRERTLLGQRKNGSRFPIEVGLHPIIVRSQHYIMATAIDITERSAAAKALADTLTERDRMRRHLMRAAEDERLRLSHELHDQTGQTLIAATLTSKGLEKFLDAEGRQQLMKLNALHDEIARTLHQVAWELRPPSIDELGLTATLDNYVSDWSEQTGIASDFHCRTGNIDHSSDEARTTIYRIIQEALTTIANHAHDTKHVSVVIGRVGKLLQLTIENDGDGFDLTEKLGTPSKYGKLGIPSMRERLALIGGTLEIESSEGLGTTVYARIPIEPQDSLS